MKKKIISCITLILIGIMIIIINIIIGKFDWHLRSCFIWLASLMIPFGIFLLGVFSLICIKNKVVRIFLMICWGLISAVVVLIEVWVLAWTINDTSIKEIDGVKYCGVEYSSLFQKEEVYYKEYNIFAYHETKECIEEFYDNDFTNPKSRTYKKVPQTDSIIYHYDKNGNITEINTYDENGNIIEMQQ